MSSIEVLKFGSSVLRSAGDLHVAIDEIYRRWRAGFRVLAVVSAFEGVTDDLLADVTEALGTDCPEATAAYLATGEIKTAALLHGSLRQYGLPSRIVDPREIDLRAAGTSLESTPIHVDTDRLDRLWQHTPILVLPGFYGIDHEGRIALFGRGGSDLSALFLAATLRAGCRLLKDVPGVFDTDPARSTNAHRFTSLSWDRAVQVAGPLIQPKALHYARSHDLSFEVGRPNESAGTLVGHTHDEWEIPPPATLRDSAPAPAAPRPMAPLRVAPLRIALYGCGVVGRGVYETLNRYARTFELRHVVVRHLERYPDISHITTDPALGLNHDLDVIVVCFGGINEAHELIGAALRAGKYVVTANKAALASHAGSLLHHTRGPDRRLWCSAAVGGALPALETLERLTTAAQEIKEIRGIVNGTCGVVLDAWSAGSTKGEAVALAQSQGFAEVDPTRDLTGRDSADKLSLMIEKAFNTWIAPDQIPTSGIDTIPSHPAGYKLIARATRTPQGIIARVAPELLHPDSFLGQARGPENRLEIELTTGEVIRLRAQGAGRWPTTVSVLGDLQELARLRESSPEAR
jgi:homoserine dehydrogenase